MAFARPPHTMAKKSSGVQKHRVEHINIVQAPEPKVALAKDLKKLRKNLSEKVSDALSMRGDIISVQSQLRGVGDAFDALSQVLVDELDYVRGDFAKTKVDMMDQMTSFSKSLQNVHNDIEPELSSMRNAAEECRDATEACRKDTSRLKHWSETGFRRLNEAMTVQQQALAVLDGQIASSKERFAELAAELAAFRSMDLESRVVSELEGFRGEIRGFREGQEVMIAEHRQKIQVVEEAARCYEQAMVDRETKHSVHFQAFSKTEADINEVRAVFEARVAALERTWRKDASKPGVPPPASESRVKDLEFELGQLKRLAAEQAETMRDLQKQISREKERPFAQSRAEQQQLGDIVARAVSEYMMRHPPRPASTASAVKGTRPVSFSSPVRGGLENTGYESPLAGGGGLEQVMLASKSRVESMRRDSERRHDALSKAVEEIDSRIRSSTS